ncbi:alpha/beta fold hydrolase [Parasphingopyxis lamellibrachiae]|uniref:2-hydroxy-6-oxo-6-(2'-aminophenyl)hexa-2, 4-dienoate hydrolase n=1 Tax=Parasphingopyxis lamellibrachiae TaxID=680125 RepID=A0A3D9F8K0_9SPHN|nr:alpha/beta hydrolase [Parasphingopyxis lamellibrachiae]RED13354.1 2-hydroxy-6-oxo-6-(2'-aminophenyl)hexa-2,4-dienoate hydrolase [Parasphingopyxis lamellibrachiae]
MTSVESKFIDAGGLRTHYLRAGAGASVILVHGGGAGADAVGNWTETVTSLAENYAVYAPDMVGFGKTEKPRRDDFVYGQAEREAHLVAFLEAIDCGPAILVGNSMGGLTSLGVAHDRPDLVRKLLLMGSAGLPVPMSPELLSIIEYDHSEEGMARIVEALTGPGFVPPGEMIAYRHALSIEPDTQYAYQQITAWQKANSGLEISEERIAAVSCPTLVVAGKNDGVVPLANAYRFLELIPQSWGVVMPNCGHWPMIEYPAEFADLVDQFARRD